MILQIVRNESIRFGGHIDIHVSYKILQSEVPKRPQFCNAPCFQEGLVLGRFGLNVALGV
jgi:hypothetical protein